MKPITHPLAIAFVDAMISNGDKAGTLGRWRAAGSPRDADPPIEVGVHCIVVDPTPLPAPALGMRVWTVGGGDGETWLREPVTINYVRPGATWSDYVKFVDEIALITNYCKGDIVLWERQ